MSIVQTSRGYRILPRCLRSGESPYDCPDLMPVKGAIRRTWSVTEGYQQGWLFDYQAAYDKLVINRQCADKIMTKRQVGQEPTATV